MRQTPNFKTSQYVSAGLGVILALMSSSIFALPSDRQQPISLEADRATFNEKTGLTTYYGNVRIVQGTMVLQADSIIAQLNRQREIQTVDAVGRPAKFQQQLSVDRGTARGEAQKINYNADTGIITLSGNAYLYQDGSSLRGSTLRYSMNKGDIEAQGSKSGRVQIIIPPSSSRTFPGVLEK